MRDAHQRPQAGLLRLREPAEAEQRERPVLVDERHDVGDGRERDHVEVPLEKRMVGTEKRLGELPDDGRAAEPGEGVVPLSGATTGQSGNPSPGRWWSVTTTSSPSARACSTSATAVIPQSTVRTRSKPSPASRVSVSAFKP